MHSGARLFRKCISDQGGAGFGKVLLWLRERAGKIALDIELSYQLVLNEDGNYDFTLHQRRPRKVTVIFCHIMYYDGPTVGGRSPAESGVEGNAGVGSEAARESPDQQDARVHRIDEIK